MSSIKSLGFLVVKSKVYLSEYMGGLFYVGIFLLYMYLFY